MKSYKLAVAVLLAFSSLLVEDIYSLECYSCTNVTDVKLCTTKATCDSTQSCFVEKSNIVNANTFDMGCLENTKCGNRFSLESVIGKRQVARCHECCSTNLCNANLCASPDETRCDDDPTIDCARLESLFSVCQDSNRAHDLCPRFCGLCRNDSQTTTKPNAVTTSDGSCHDRKSNCDKYDDAGCRGIFEHWARYNCRNRCGYCDSVEVTTSAPGPKPISGATTTRPSAGGVVIVSSSSYKIQGVKSPVNGTCFHQDKTYNKGDHWQDTCRYDCQCIDTDTNTALCNDVCPHYSSLPPSCTIRQKTGDCCPKLDCGNETQLINQSSSVNVTGSVNASDCQDKIPGCEYYEEIVCRGIYEPWAKAHCSLRCGYCGYTAPCVDTLTYCDAYELTTACRDFPGWARFNCRKSCGQCT